METLDRNGTEDLLTDYPVYAETNVPIAQPTATWLQWQSAAPASGRFTYEQSTWHGFREYDSPLAG